MPTWENTIKPKKDVSFDVALALSHFLGYSFLQFENEVFAVVNSSTYFLTSHAPLE